MQKVLVGVGLLGGVLVAVLLLRQQPEQTLADSLKQMQAERKAVAPESPKPKSVSDLPVASEQGPWPVAVIEDPVFEFGRMPVMGKNSHRFIVENRGEAELELKAGNTTCKCTKFGFGESAESAVDRVKVAPGEKAVLLINWKAGDAPDRAFRHGGDVHTNDPKNPLLKVAVEGAIEMPFDVMPQFTWDFGSIYDKAASFKGGIASRLHEKFAIEKVESPSGNVRVEVVPMTIEELGTDSFVGGFTLQAEVAQDIPSGLFSEELLLWTSVSEDPVRITVKARKFGAIRLQPLPGTQLNPETLTLMMGSFRAAEGKEFQLLVIVDEKDMQEPFAITKTEADPSFISAAIAPLGEPSGTVHRYRLTLKIPPGRPTTQRTASNPGFVRLQTNHPSGDAISLGLMMYSN
ncbi:MAG: DUF1573 domain-containing protein [Planctomyces sp.]|jgi:hypothetical protein